MCFINSSLFVGNV